MTYFTTNNRIVNCIHVHKIIVFNSNTDFNLAVFRLGLMRAMKSQGWEVHAVCPLDKYKKDLEEDNIIVHNVRLSRHGKNPLQDALYLIRIYRIFRSVKPLVIHSFTIKPNIYGNLAATLAGIPKRINTVSGLGYVYIGSNVKKKILLIIVNLLYKIAFIFSHKVIFQNDDDHELFTEKYHIVSKEKTVVIKSSGVDCDYFSMETVDHGRIRELREQFDIPKGSFVVLMAARMIWEKGVKEFVEAAKIVKAEHPEVIFLLAGPLEPGSPSALPEHYLLSHRKDVQWIGHQKDMKHIIALASIVVLPSYREGVPRILLEAMAMGKPIITTDTVGCREVIEHKKNGLLISIKDSKNLLLAIETLINNQEKLISYGIYSRKKVKLEFSDQYIIDNYTKEYITQ